MDSEDKSSDPSPPSPVWPKYLYGEKIGEMTPNKGVQILKERFYQQKVLSAHNDAESNISERKIGSIYSWLEGVRQVNTSNISKMQCKVKIFSLSHQIISDI